jgi:hypothetical protein
MSEKIKKNHKEISYDQDKVLERNPYRRAAMGDIT